MSYCFVTGAMALQTTVGNQGDMYQSSNFSRHLQLPEQQYGILACCDTSLQLATGIGEGEIPQLTAAALIEIPGSPGIIMYCEEGKRSENGGQWQETNL
jgi:hypothetical protein